MRALAVPVVALAALLFAAPATAAPVDGAKRTHYRYGPITVNPGTNNILLNDRPIPKPRVDGYITRIKPDMTDKRGAVIPTDELMLHHAVWLNNGQRVAGEDPTFFAVGEEKTIAQLPEGFGFPVRGSDQWRLNYMLHNLTSQRFSVWLDYTIDFIPKASAEGRKTKPAYPLWMDVEKNRAYPVFDVPRGAGSNGRFTYPDDAANAYADGNRRNVVRAPVDMTLLETAAHLHPGGLYGDLEVRRPGTTPAGKGPVKGHSSDSVRLFRSMARYFDPGGPISWDVAMTATPDDWRPRIKAGDELSVRATYETERAAWYESMGIMVTFWSPTARGVDPFRTALPQKGKVTHGQLPESQGYGGQETGLPTPALGPAGPPPTGAVQIRDFRFSEGDLAAEGAQRLPPAVPRGQSLRFENQDALNLSDPNLLANSILHSVTGCRLPCTKSPGISYPLADGPVDFDSGNLGWGPEGITAAANRPDWETPKDLDKGTYAYFCRIHPFMRGAFRVVDP